MVQTFKTLKSPPVNIGIIGKYTELVDAYKSVNESLVHASIFMKNKVNIEWISSERLKSTDEALKHLDGILIPGGFGDRGIEGKIRSIQYAREFRIPFLGICLGLQCAVIEFARNVCSIKGANSSEFLKDHNLPAVIDIMSSQTHIDDKGGTMRLGQYPCVIKKGTLAAKLYKKYKVNERHRHRYEVNNRFRNKLESKGMVMSGLSPDKKLVEIIEIPSHPFFIAVQFHPEFQSTPLHPHPLFIGLVRASLQKMKSK